ncbi:MAG TPA: hypothetical protein VJ864_01735 [Candidatus Binatia bacterium]|nr:hypothetical protein [Candidatus Binatia bacterium]
MKSIDARTTLKLVLSFFWFIALAMVSSGYAGDYYIYQDPNGKLVLSNYAPRDGGNVIKKETLAEVTDQQIMESQAREHRVALENRLSSLERTIGELTENLRTQSEVINSVPESYGDTNIGVGVTQAPIIVAKPPRRKFNRPANFRPNLPNAQPRSAVPAARCCGSGRAG